MNFTMSDTWLKVLEQARQVWPVSRDLTQRRLTAEGVQTR